MRSLRRPLHPARPVVRLGLACGLWCMLLLVATVQVAAQPPAASRPDDTVLGEAERAFRTGRYEQVESLTAPLSAPRAILLRARAATLRGQYDTAIDLLRAPAAAAPGGDAALELGTLLGALGRRAEGDRLLGAVLERNADNGGQDALVRAARAARALSRFEQANQYFRNATLLGLDDPSVPTAWGELFLEKHNQADALRSFRQALQIDRGHAPALVGLARTMSDTNPPVARQVATRALSINPNFAPAHLLLADLALDEGDRAAASAFIDRALAVNPRDLEALSARAAVAFLEDRRDDFEADVRRVLDINPVYADVYRLAGAHAARHYRFDDAVALARRAVALEPASARASAELGMHLLRTGDEPAARAALDAAFRLDPYDAVTYNLLGLLDTLDTFVTIEEGPIVLRLHPDEAPVLREHAMPLARDALRTLSARYGLTPQGPVLVEIFPRHDDFAVRTLGLPGMIGALGACFGRVVTADSPRARPPGTFSWQATLWHEMAHVVTLQLSKQRVPRWLTEGISVYEEQRARPEWGREMQVPFAEAMTRNRVIPLAELDKGFTDPERISLAYYEASLVVTHIVEHHGEAALRALLVAYGEGLETPAAIERALGGPLGSLQRSFSAAIQKQFAPLVAALAPPPDGQLAGVLMAEPLAELAAKYPGSYPVQMALGQALEEAGNADGATRAYEAAAALVPYATGEDSPRALIAKLAMASGNHTRAADALEAQLAFDHENVEAARRLAAIVDDQESPRAIAAYTRVADLDPFDSAAQTVLGRHALAAGDADAAARWFRVALATGPRDQVAAHCDLADAYRRLGAAADAKHEALAALEIAPTFPRAQDLLLAVVEGQP